jgi:hypothetical protein
MRKPSFLEVLTVLRKLIVGLLYLALILVAFASLYFEPERAAGLFAASSGCISTPSSSSARTRQLRQSRNRSRPCAEPKTQFIKTTILGMLLAAALAAGQGQPDRVFETKAGRILVWKPGQILLKPVPPTPTPQWSNSVTTLRSITRSDSPASCSTPSPCPVLNPQGANCYLDSPPPLTGFGSALDRLVVVHLYKTLDSESSEQ